MSLKMISYRRPEFSYYYKFATYARIFHSKHITDLDIDNFLEQAIDHLIQHHIEHKNDELLQMQLAKHNNLILQLNFVATNQTNQYENLDSDTTSWNTMMKTKYVINKPKIQAALKEAFWRKLAYLELFQNIQTQLSSNITQPRCVLQIVSTG